ncbi:MAG: glycosyltransferase [Patescibacteria group bacterium]
MKIAFFSDNFYPELSGITDTIITTTKELKRRGHEILYVGPYYSPQNYTLANRQFPQRPEDDAIDGMRILRLPSWHMPLSPTGQSRIVPAFAALPDGLRAFAPDLIHTHSPYGVGLAAVRAARRLAVPLVGTNHTAIEDFFPPGMRAIMRRWDAHYYNHCDFVSAPYARLIERMRTAGFAKPGRAVSNPADVHEFMLPTPKERAEHREAFGLTGPTLLYAGRLGVEKRVDVMVRATALLVKQFPTFTFVATGHGAARRSLERLAQRLGIGTHVRFTSYLSRAALPHVYQAADVFGMTSTSDSQSLALMQAYASGLPAVLARARGLPDYAPKECSFLIEPGDAKAFAEAAALVLGDESRRAQMSVAAAAYVTRFDPSLIAGEWERIYLDTISARAARSSS